MPVNQVKTPQQEAMWNKAKQQVHKQYPNLKESDKKFWQRVSTIYQNMKKSG
jgi:hypothetical protein